MNPRPTPPPPPLHHHSDHHHRHLRLSVPLPPSASRLFHPPFPTPTTSSPFPFSPSTASTPSKRLRHPTTTTASSNSLTSLLLLLLSLRSLYSLLPFLRSSTPSFSLFPFSFLVACLSFLLTFLFPSSTSDPHHHHPSILSLPLLRPIAFKSLLVAAVLLIRFQALRSCGTAATILADLCGALAARSLSASAVATARKISGFAAMAVALVLLSHGWDRVGCFPLSLTPSSSDADCIRILPMLLPFFSGFLGFYERSSTYWAPLRQLGRRRTRLLSLAFAAALLFFPAIGGFLAGGAGNVSLGDLGWNLMNVVVFGVVMCENYGDDKRDFRREFMVTFFCTLVLELFYFPQLSLPGFLFFGFLLWISVNQLSYSSSSYLELGSSAPSESLYSKVMNPVRHILSERKSRKIAFFLLINTAYMVVEFVVGFMSNSLGLISDACHMLFDCAALTIGLYASYISRLPANSQYNYGRGRFEVLSGYVNAVFLVLVGALIVLESFERILDPQEISTNSLLTVSIGGLLVNVVGLVFFHEEHHHAHGGGTCSHSHSHSHQPHHHHLHNNVVHSQEPNAEHQTVDLVGHESFDGKPQSNQNGHCCHHDDHHHSHVGDYRSDTKVRKNDHCCHGGEHDHHDHAHHIDAHVHENLSEAKHEHQSANITSVGSLDIHRHKGHQHENCHDDKGHCSHGDLPSSCHLSNHAHSHSSHSKESSAEGKLLQEHRKHHHIDHNMEGIFLHVLADTMGSVGVVISTLLIKYKGWLVADPASSIFISVLIISSVIPLLRNSAEILLQRVPRTHEQDLKVAMDDVMRVKGVCGIHNMHVWNFTNTDIVGTLHLHVLAETDKAEAKQQVSHILHEVGIKDLTIQVECLKV